jgi:hypothetical protein
MSPSLSCRPRRVSFASIGIFGLLVCACEGGKTFDATRSLTSTVTVSTERSVVVDAPVPIVIRGRSSARNILVELEATFTSSSSTVSQQLADALELEVERPNPNTVRIGFNPPKRGRISGEMQVELPDALAVDAFGRGATADVVDVRGVVRLEAAAGARAVGGENDLSVEVVSGNAIVETRAFPGTVTRVRVRRGDIDITLPRTPSVGLTATLGNGQLVIAHPELPRFLGNPPYVANLRGRLATVEIIADFGNVVIR